MHGHPSLAEPDELTLRRIQLLGHLAAAARLALEDCEHADTVDLHINASTVGMTVDCVLMVGAEPIQGWGQ